MKKNKDRQNQLLPPESVFIVDPDRDFLKSTEKFLTSRGYTVLTAWNGTQALKKISATASPLLALVSLRLHDVSGEVLIKRLHEHSPDLAIILTDIGEEPSANYMQFGVIDFLPKPIDQEVLISAVRNIPTILNPLVEDEGKEGTGLLAQFFPFLVHELRNPLQAIGGALTIIEKRTDLQDQPLAQSINIIKDEVQHLTGFVQKCLDFVRPVNKDFTLETDLNELIRLCLKMVTYMMPGTAERVEIAAELDPQLPKVYVNYEEIKHVLLNCLKNSMEAMQKRPAPKLQLLTTSKVLNQSGWVEIHIRDSGEGIKKENLKLIGTPFFTTKIRGTGLGLAVCNRIIADRHKGKVLIESEEGKGTEITIKLPLTLKGEGPDQGAED
ncbi:MAG: ATP-binding protein [Thermodesulfobacteriota bacterium]